MTATTIWRHKGILVGVLLVPSLLIAAVFTVGALALLNVFGQKSEPLYFVGPHVASASVHVGQDVTVKATRCNKAKHPVQYHATKVWETVSPPGSSIVVGTSAATEQPGCTTFTFVNPMPQLVISRTQGLLSVPGTTSVTWQIAAIDTPEGHGYGGTVSWTTTPIVVTK